MSRPSDVVPLKPETESQEGEQGVWKWSCMHLISEENKFRLWTVSVYSRLRRSRVPVWQQLDMNQAGHHFSCLRDGCSWLDSNPGYPSLGLPLFYAMFEVLIALTVQTTVFWTVTPYSPVEVHLLFGRTVSTFFLPRTWTHYFLPPNLAEFLPFYRLSCSTNHYCCRVDWKFMGRRAFSSKIYGI